MCTMAVIRTICALLIISKISQPGECSMQAVFHRSKEKYLANHVIATKQARSEIECGMYCARDGSCLSANYKTSGIGKGRCELNNKVLQETSDADKQTNAEFNHLNIIKKKQQDIGEAKPEAAFSCKELLDKNKVLKNGVYNLRSNTSLDEYEVYCHMTEIPGCGPGGWTLVMKIDGNKTDFNYTSPYWTNTKTYAVERGLEGLTENQSKLASYWNTPFNKTCLGMKASGGATKWIAIDYEASSLFSVIAHGGFTSTSIGKEAWKSLLDELSIDKYCNREGFNVDVGNTYNPDAYIKVRIGMVTNNFDHCNHCDSCIGFGISLRGCDGKMRRSSCGNIKALCTSQETDTDTATFGFILVQ